jgi:hypothetical protein
MKALVLIAICVATAAAQSPNPSATVARIHDGMMAPASFVLDGVYLTKPDKKGAVTVCVAFRAANSVGGMAEGRATDDGKDFEIIRQSEVGSFQGYDTGWVRPCTAKKIDRDVTADVAATAPALYKKTR